MWRVGVGVKFMGAAHAPIGFGMWPLPSTLPCTQTPGPWTLLARTLYCAECVALVATSYPMRGQQTLCRFLCSMLCDLFSV